MKNGWNKGGQERLPVGEFVELCVCENPHVHFQLARWLIIKAYWDGEHWCHAGAERVQGLIGGWRPIRREEEPPPKNRSGFIRVHYRGSAVWVLATSIVHVIKAPEFTKIDLVGGAEYFVDETPEQILKLIEEVES